MTKVDEIREDVDYRYADLSFSVSHC